MLFLTMSVCSSRAMDTDHFAWLHVMPSDIIGAIMVQLAKNIGTPSVCNKADIPVIINYTKALSLTNKDLYTKVNNTIVSRMFIVSLAQRFYLDPFTIAGEINNPGTREWLTHQLKATGEYELFKQLQRIFEITQEVRQEFKSLHFTINDELYELPKLHPCYNQTKQGFFICAEKIPNKLYTPWGHITLFENGYGKEITF